MCISSRVTDPHAMPPQGLTDPSELSAQNPVYAVEKPPEIVIRSVWAHNLTSEFVIIRDVVDRFPIIAMDTEFPGVIVRPDPVHRHRNPDANYTSLKTNVDELKLIQIGLTLSDEEGNLPDLGSGSTRYIWEFNFKDFDIAHDKHAHDSVELLKRQGIDFEKNRELGIDSLLFAELMISSGLVLNEDVTWVTFHSAYDFGYLVKCLMPDVLPKNLTDFLDRVILFFGKRVYDIKHLMRFCASLYGGLDRVCKALNVERVIGKSHQAGSDSLLTLHAFLKIKDVYFGGDCENEKYTNVLHGLERKLKLLFCRYPRQQMGRQRFFMPTNELSIGDFKKLCFQSIFAYISPSQMPTVKHLQDRPVLQLVDLFGVDGHYIIS